MEMVLMIGYPGSGKSTLVSQMTHSVISGDVLKTPAKMIQSARSKLQHGNSVVIDATNPSKEHRAKYINLAKEFNIPVRCIHVTTSFEESMRRNKTRTVPVSKIAYYIFRKKFEEPTGDEGCIVQKFVSCPS